uniref:Uncharacterized protein n=1 Tax=Acrobeloides nanus TaxID=290746 RepID=A0A914EE94_9BILA
MVPASEGQYLFLLWPAQTSIPSSICDELFQAIQEEWARIPRNTILGLVESMPCCIRAVIKAKGYVTKY